MRQFILLLEISREFSYLFQYSILFNEKKKEKKIYSKFLSTDEKSSEKKKEFYATSLAVKTGYLGEEVLQGF